MPAWLRHLHGLACWHFLQMGPCTVWPLMSAPSLSRVFSGSSALQRLSVLHLFLRPGNIPLSGCAPLVHQSSRRPLGCFHFLTLVSYATVNAGARFLV